MTTEPASPRRTDLPTGAVTFMFTDIEGSTRLPQEVGEDLAIIIDRHHAILRSAGRAMSAEELFFDEVDGRSAI